MLVHCGITVSSLDNAREVFEGIFHLPVAWSFDVGPDVMSALFGIRTAAHVRVYDLGNTRLEVFVIQDMPPPGRIQHLCLEFEDREPVIRRSEDSGFDVFRYSRPGGDVVFVRDRDANLYELKDRTRRSG